MFGVRSASDERDAHIGEGHPGEHARMVALHGVAQGETLPVAIEVIFRAARAKLHPRSARQRFQLYAHLGIVAQRLEVTHPFDRFDNRLLVEDAAGAEFHLDAISITQELANHVLLNLAHKLSMGLLELFMPGNSEERVLACKLAKCAHEGGGVGSRRGDDLVGEDGGEQRAWCGGLCTERAAGHSARETCDRADAAGGQLGHRFVALPLVEANLVDLFGPWRAMIGALDHHLSAERAARDL